MERTGASTVARPHHGVVQALHPNKLGSFGIVGHECSAQGAAHVSKTVRGAQREKGRGRGGLTH